MSFIIDNLFLGDLEDANNEKFIKKNNIKYLVSVGEEFKKGILKNNFESGKNIIISVRDKDDEKIEKYFENCSEFIKKSLLRKENVLVHCAYGVSRSPCIVIAFLMKEKNWSYEKTFKFVKMRRDFIRPNDGFIKKLKEWERSLIKNQCPWRKI